MPSQQGHRILVTGGAGFIGSNLVHYLLGEAAGDLAIPIDRVVTLDKLTYAGNRENLSDLDMDSRHRLVVGDICDANLVGNLLREEEINLVMHLAAESHVDRSIDASAEFIQTNVIGTHTLLEEFRAWANELGFPETDSPTERPSIRFLHVSTDEVYGSLSLDDPAFSETTPYAPNSPYSASKAGSDHLARAWHHTYGLPVIITNCSNNYGPYQFPEKLLPLMIGKLRKGEKLPVYGDGSNIRDWLYVTDHCRALVLAAVRGTPGEVYNIGGNCERKNLDVVHALIETVSRIDPGMKSVPPEEAITFVTDRPGHDWRYAIDSSKIQKELGWSPRETFASGLEKTVRWYLENNSWIEHIEDGSYQGERLGSLE
ncbi:MAG: dTDP-glucose 4,6-dehydratase [Verrucomicrobiales bacterium]|nr:dTDP-glucose 4,6-dehydratase [Verrucomicrobiales bacterium]